MSETRDKYERALRRRDNIFSAAKGGLSESKEKELASATAAVIRYRNKLIENGEWEGPIPLPVRKRQRG